MSQQWYHVKNGQRHGPVPAERLKTLAVSGDLQRTDLVWREGMPQWVQAGTVGGLFPPAPSAPPPPATPPSLPPKTTTINTTAPPAVTGSNLAWLTDKNHPVSKVIGGIFSLLVLLGIGARLYLRHTGKLSDDHRFRASTSQTAPMPQQTKQMQAGTTFLAANKEFTETLQHYMAQMAEIDAAEKLLISKHDSDEPYGDVATTLIAANEAAKKDAEVLAALYQRALLGNPSPDGRERMSSSLRLLTITQSVLFAQHERLKQIQLQLNSSTPDASVIAANWDSYVDLADQLQKASSE